MPPREVNILQWWLIGMQLTLVVSAHRIEGLVGLAVSGVSLVCFGLYWWVRRWR